MSIQPLLPALNLELTTFLVSPKRGRCVKCTALKTPKELQGVWFMKFPTPYVKPLCKFCLIELDLVPSGFEDDAIEIEIPGPVTAIVSKLVRQANLFGLQSVRGSSELQYGTLLLTSLIADEETRKRWHAYQWIGYGDAILNTGKEEYGPIIHTRIDWRVQERIEPLPARRAYAGEVEDVTVAHMAALLVSGSANADPNLQLNVVSAERDRLILKAVYNCPDSSNSPNPSKNPDAKIGSIEVDMKMHWNR